MRECATPVPGGRVAALDRDRPERARGARRRAVASGRRRRCGGCSPRRGSAGSASTTARSSRRRSGPRSSRPPRRRRSGRGSPTRSGARTRPRAATCSAACSSAATAARSSSRGPARAGSAAMPARKARASRGCGKTYINADQVEQFVVEAVLHRVDAPEVAAALEGRAGRPGRAALATTQLDADTGPARGARRRLRRAGSSRWPRWRAARKPIEQRMTAARKQLCRVTRTSTLDRSSAKARSCARSGTRSTSASSTRSSPPCSTTSSSAPAGRGYNRFDESRLTPVWRP